MSFVNGQRCHLENKWITMEASREARREKGAITWMCGHSERQGNYEGFAECVNV